ncbi:hypothetical protein C8Q79DRAFT_201369 [Trametes meyenii]|nr:hypothetical protein C8Q79DRAFT_201369 [Trametes meyenii]
MLRIPERHRRWSVILWVVLHEGGALARHSMWTKSEGGLRAEFLRPTSSYLGLITRTATATSCLARVDRQLDRTYRSRSTAGDTFSIIQRRQSIAKDGRGGGDERKGESFKQADSCQTRRSRAGTQPHVEQALPASTATQVGA